MVISKDDICSREPRPQFVRSKSVGAGRRRTHGPTEARQQKKKPYSSSTKCKTAERLSRERSIVKGSNLSEEIPDYPSRGLLPLSAESHRNSLYLSTEGLADHRVLALDRFDGQEGGELRHLYPELENHNLAKHNLPEKFHKIRADSWPAGLMQMASHDPEFLSSENTDNPCQQNTMDDVPSTTTQRSRHRAGVRRSRKPLADCNLQDNHMNPQRDLYVDNATDSQRVGQSEAYQHKHHTRGQDLASGTRMSQQFNYDENMTHETILRCCASTEEDKNDYEADQTIHSPGFRDQFLDSAQHNMFQMMLTPAGEEGWELTDDIDIRRRSDDGSHQLPSFLRRQDTLLLHQDNNVDHDDEDDGDDEGFHSFFESLKPFLCCEVPNDSDLLRNDEEYHQINNVDDMPDEAPVSYKNFFNCPPRYQCALCDSNLEREPFQQQGWGCENDFVQFFIDQDSTRRADLYCPQCCCTRSIYCTP